MNTRALYIQLETIDTKRTCSQKLKHSTHKITQPAEYTTKEDANTHALSKEPKQKEGVPRRDQAETKPAKGSRKQQQPTSKKTYVLATDVARECGMSFPLGISVGN